MNDYDKAGRYLVKREPTGFLRWLFANPRVDFRAWIDARRVALPKQSDLTNDLVAVVGDGDTVEAVCLELEAEARADALTRLLGYLIRLWSEPGGRDSVAVSCVSGVIVDLTGRSPAKKLELRSEIVSGCKLELTLLRRHLTDEDAAATVASVAAGQTSPWVLGWLPLMRGGCESAIIAQWVEAAERHLAAERDRGDLGMLTLVLADLARCRPAWDRGLRRWNMKTVPFLDEIRAEVREEGREEGRAEGREQGRAEGMRATLLRQGRAKFGKPPAKKQQKALEAMANLTRLEALTERLLHVDSWNELLAGL
jgi:hypothetical protein